MIVVALPGTELVDVVPTALGEEPPAPKDVGVVPGETPPGNADERPLEPNVKGSTTARTSATDSPEATRTLVLTPQPEITAVSHPMPPQYFTG